MSIEALNWAFEVDVSNPSDRTFLLAIANYANEDDEAWPSYKNLQKKCVCSRSTVARKVKSLANRGYLTITQGLRNDGSYSSNIYKLHTRLKSFGDNDGGVKLTPAYVHPDDTSNGHSDDTGGGVTQMNSGGVIAAKPQEPSSNHQSEPSEKEKESCLPPASKKTNPHKGIMPLIYSPVADRYLTYRDKNWPTTVPDCKSITLCNAFANLDLPEEPDDAIHGALLKIIGDKVINGEYTERRPANSLGTAIESALREYNRQDDDADPTIPKFTECTTPDCSGVPHDAKGRCFDCMTGGAA